jgi:hypothetical protein
MGCQLVSGSSSGGGMSVSVQDPLAPHPISVERLETRSLLCTVEMALDQWYQRPREDLEADR